MLSLYAYPSQQPFNQKWEAIMLLPARLTRSLCSEVLANTFKIQLYGFYNIGPSSFLWKLYGFANGDIMNEALDLLWHPPLGKGFALTIVRFFCRVLSSAIQECCSPVQSCVLAYTDEWMTRTSSTFKRLDLTAVFGRECEKKTKRSTVSFSAKGDITVLYKYRFSLAM